MKRMSFFLTTPQMLARTKTVTRRLKCRLKVGERFTAIEKGQGLQKGEKQRVLGVCEVVDISFQPVASIICYDNGDLTRNDDCVREGFPQMIGHQFVDMFCKAMKCTPADSCYRIQFVFVGCEA